MRPLYLNGDRAGEAGLEVCCTDTRNCIARVGVLFICHPPETPSLIDYLGPWPWYIFSLEVLGILFFLLVYAPFGVKDLVARWKKRRAAAVV